MISIAFLTSAGIVLTLCAVAGLALVRGPAQIPFVVGMLCLAVSWLLPAILSILLQQQQLDALPWPANAITNVVLYSVGAALILLAALNRDPRR